jgi:hypothetical protein
VLALPVSVFGNGKKGVFQSHQAQNEMSRAMDRQLRRSRSEKGQSGRVFSPSSCFFPLFRSSTASTLDFPAMVARTLMTRRFTGSGDLALATLFRESHGDDADFGVLWTTLKF